MTVQANPNGGPIDPPAEPAKKASAEETMIERLAAFLPALADETAVSPLPAVEAAEEEPVATPQSSNERSSAPSSQHTDAVRYFVCEVELGARIYKVPAEKISLIDNQPEAGDWKFFENLDDAKTEVKTIFDRISEARARWGLTTSILDQPLQDIMDLKESNVPEYIRYKQNWS